MHQKNIYEVIEETGEKISTLVIPKNSGLKEYAWKVLKQACLDLDGAVEVEKNSLKVGGLTLIQRRGEDIPQVVVDYAIRRGEIVLGITGDDLFDEFCFRVPQNPLKIENTYDWFDEDAKYFRPALCFINRTGDIEDVPLESRIAMNSKYTSTSRDYLRNSSLTQDRSFEETVYNGNVEITVTEETNDCCIDMIYSGDTLKENGLKEMDIIRFSDLVVISALKRDESLFGKVMSKEWTVMSRKKNPTDSYTSRLLGDPEKVARKGNEEMYELIQAFNGNGDFLEEYADVIYSLNLMLVSAGYSLDDIAKVMAKRQK